ncbi:MAG: hypothetical protein ABH950_08670 [Candidatus Altiarchaeota archaeon]
MPAEKQKPEGDLIKPFSDEGYFRRFKTGLRMLRESKSDKIDMSEGRFLRRLIKEGGVTVTNQDYDGLSDWWRDFNSSPERPRGLFMEFRTTQRKAWNYIARKLKGEVKYGLDLSPLGEFEPDEEQLSDSVEKVSLRESGVARIILDDVGAKSLKNILLSVPPISLKDRGEFIDTLTVLSMQELRFREVLEGLGSHGDDNDPGGLVGAPLDLINPLFSQDTASGQLIYSLFGASMEAFFTKVVENQHPKKPFSLYAALLGSPTGESGLIHDVILFGLQEGNPHAYMGPAVTPKALEPERIDNLSKLIVGGVVIHNNSERLDPREKEFHQTGWGECLGRATLGQLVPAIYPNLPIYDVPALTPIAKRQVIRLTG